MTLLLSAHLSPTLEYIGQNEFFLFLRISIFLLNNLLAIGDLKCLWEFEDSHQCYNEWLDFTTQQLCTWNSGQCLKCEWVAIISSHLVLNNPPAGVMKYFERRTHIAVSDCTFYWLWSSSVFVTSDMERRGDLEWGSREVGGRGWMGSRADKERGLEPGRAVLVDGRARLTE